MIYNVRGELVASLADARLQQTARCHAVIWHGDAANGRKVASGIYPCHLVTETLSLSKRLVLVK